MKIIVAEYSGFCFGVERAVKITSDAAKKYSSVVTYGPIIHNPQVVDNFKRQGVNTIDNISDIPPNSTVIIRTHGISVNEKERLGEVSSSVIDATCPFVKKVQEAAKALSDEGICVIVVGEADHPEVKGIISYISGNCCHVINSIKEAEELDFADSYGVVAQTTQNEDKYNKIVDVISSKCKQIKSVNTICGATNRRQKAVEELAKKVDVMIIVGGKNSANTARLFELCKGICKNSYHIETVNDLDDNMFLGAECVGISAGASTPLEFVEQVKEYILEKGR